ncbi:MAG: ornithine cyclodeaminase family protein [Actinomycetota bacterium]
MSGPVLIDPEELRAALPMEAAIDALESTFREGRIPHAPPRTVVDLDHGELLVMPAVGEAGAGVKLVTVAPGNPARGLPLIHAAYVLFDAGSLEPSAMIDGGALTALRTAAVSGVATRHLARDGAERLVLFGAGVQATAHLESMRAVRPIREVVVVGRSPERAAALVDAARAGGLQARSGGPDAVAGADIVCACTTSATPLFDGGRLPPGAHVNAVGSYQPHTRELDDETIRRARIVVETRDAAMSEAGDLLIPLGAGVISASAIAADLAELVGGARVRRDAEDVTVFKSVGVAFEDLVVAGAAVAAMAR